MFKYSIALVIFCFSCVRPADSGNKVTLYSDTSGDSVETRIPFNWKKYDVPDFKGDNNILFSAYGSKDTSQQLVIDVYKALEQQNLSNLIKQELERTRASDTGVVLIALKESSPADQYQFAYFDYYTKGSGTIYYSENIVFQKEELVFKIIISSIGDEQTFKHLTNLVRGNLKY